MSDPSTPTPASGSSPPGTSGGVPGGAAEPSHGSPLRGETRRRPWAMLAGLLLGTLWVWGPSSIPQNPGPSFDDREAIVGNPVVDGSLPATAAFERDYWHHLEDAGHFRPLASLLLRWDWREGPNGREAEPDWRRFRLTNVTLHLLIVLLLGAAFIRLDRRLGVPVPWIGLGLLALHPACADVVAWISGRTSLVSGLGAAAGILGATLLSRRSQVPGLSAAAVAFLACGLALLGKEDGVVLVPVLAVLMGRVAGHRAGLGGFAGGLAALAVVAALRHGALGSALPSSPSAPLAGLPLVDRLGVGLAAWSRGIQELATPWADWPPSVHLSDLQSSPGTWARAAALILCGLVAALVLIRRTARERGRSRAQAATGLLSLGAVGLAMVPLVQVIPAGELFAPRFVYQPLILGSYAAAALVAAGLSLLRSRPLRAVVQVGVLLACAAAVPDAAAVYTGRASFWRAHLPAHAGDPRVWNDLGNAAREAGDLAEARAAFERAVALDPDYSRPRTNLGTLALAAGDLIEAELQLRAAVAVGPDNPVARANLGNVLLRAKAYDEAVAEYERAVEIAPGRSAYHRGLGRALRGAGDREGARAAFEQALALDPGDERARAELARTASDR